MTTSLPTILIVDDEVLGLESLARILSDEFDVKTASTIDAARKILSTEWVQVILCDQRMPEMLGVEFLKEVREEWPDVIRMIISGYSDSEDIISALNEAGIYQYISKPWHPDNLTLILRNAVTLYKLQREKDLLSIELKASPQQLMKQMTAKRKKIRSQFQETDGIVRTENSSMNKVCDKIMQVSPFDVSVLITGESGTGKELAARSLHYNSLRWDKPFVVENCAALPNELLESELFGYKKGAFTGAVEDRIGLFERANGGTVFLDEIGEVSQSFQVKLLRVLQEGEIRPVGGGSTRTVDVRIVAATNKDLEAEVRAGRFREDLYYRIATVCVTMPPLRDRREDIPLLANRLLERAMQSLGKEVKGFSDEALVCMQDYHWSGNVRELQNEIQQMLVMTKEDVLGADLLSPRVLQAQPRDQEEDELDVIHHLTGTLKDRVELMEARILKETLIRHRWNKSRAAVELGLSRVGLRNKLERYGLEKVERLNYESETKRTLNS